MLRVCELFGETIRNMFACGGFAHVSSSISSEAFISSNLEYLILFVDELLVYSIYQYSLCSFCVHVLSFSSLKLLHYIA